jgi:hypothetical protein
LAKTYDEPIPFVTGRQETCMRQAIFQIGFTCRSNLGRALEIVDTAIALLCACVSDIQYLDVPP